MPEAVSRVKEPRTGQVRVHVLEEVTFSHVGANTFIIKSSLRRHLLSVAGGGGGGGGPRAFRRVCAAPASECAPRSLALVGVSRRFLPAKLRIKLPAVDHIFRILVARTYIDRLARPKRRRVRLSLFLSSFTFFFSPPPHSSILRMVCSIF